MYIRPNGAILASDIGNIFLLELISPKIYLILTEAIKLIEWSFKSAIFSSRLSARHVECPMIIGGPAVESHC